MNIHEQIKREQDWTRSQLPDDSVYHRIHAAATLTKRHGHNLPPDGSTATVLCANWRPDAPGGIKAACENCHRDVLLSPSTDAAMKARAGHTRLLCAACVEQL